MPGLKGIVNLTLDTDYNLYNGKSLRDFNDKTIIQNTDKIIHLLVEFIVSSIKGNDLPMPAFVKAFGYQQSNEPFCLRYNQEYFVRNDFTEMVMEGVRKKEKRIGAYRKNANTVEYWLLLVYGGASLSSGFKVNEDSLAAIIGKLPIQRILT